MKNLISTLIITGALALTSQAGVIDFESGFTDQQAVNTIVTSDNVVTIGVGNTAASQGDAFIAQAGGKTTAYVPNDKIPTAGNGGEFFLTDEVNGPKTKFNYYFSFENAISSLSLDLYDFRKDGGPKVGDRATLTAYDEFSNVVSLDFWAIPKKTNDPNLVHLSLTGAGITNAALEFSRGDVGTGIDNIAFETEAVPEPATVGLLLLGLGGVFFLKRKRS